MSDRIAVMREGKIVELGNAEEIYNHPKTDYTKALLDAIPKLKDNF
jgi:ABC-type oligopeptide transport system ATPase subunit